MKLKPNNEYRDTLKFYCKTSYIDKIVCMAKKIKYDQVFGKRMERDARMYLAVTPEGEVISVPGHKIEPYKVHDRGSRMFRKIYKPLPDQDIPDRETAAIIEKFIEKVHGINVSLAWIS